MTDLIKIAESLPLTPKLTFEEYINELSMAKPGTLPELDADNHTLNTAYAMYMPKILQSVKNIKDAQQLISKLHGDVKSMNFSSNPM